MSQHDPDGRLYGPELQFMDESLILWSAPSTLAEAERPYADGGALPLGAMSVGLEHGFPASAATHSRDRVMDPMNAHVPGQITPAFGGISDLDYSAAAFGAAAGATRFGAGDVLDLPAPPGQVRNPVPAFGLTIASGSASFGAKALLLSIGAAVGFFFGRRRR